MPGATIANYTTLKSIPTSATSHRKSRHFRVHRIRSTSNHTSTTHSAGQIVHYTTIPLSIANPLKIRSTENRHNPGHNRENLKIRADAKSAEIRSHSPKNTKKLKNAMMNRQRALFGRLIFSRKPYPIQPLDRLSPAHSSQFSPSR